MLSPQPLSIEAPRRNPITAISSGLQRRPIVLVLGMHRSGTSLCAHLLSALGVDMADEIAGPGNPAPTPDNARGHWERWEIVEFHDRILALFNRDYWGRFHDFALPVAWWADPRVAQIRREIVAFLERRMDAGYFGFKDPRMVRLMPVWHQIFNELKLAPKLVLCLRNPAQVARSLHARDGLDREIGEYRWLVHLVDFFRYANSYDFCTVEYEGWFEDPSANLEKLRQFLGLQWQQSEPDLTLLLAGVVDRALRHDDAEQREANQPLVRSLYKLATRAGQDSEARDQIAYIVSQFVGFQQLQRPFQQAFEEVARVAAKLPEVEQEAEALRAAVGELESVAGAADARAADIKGHLADACLEIEQQRAQIADLTKSRGELDEALQAAQAEAAAQAAALDKAEREALEGSAMAQAMQAEVGALRAALAHAEQEARERSAAAESARTERAATIAALQAEVAALRTRLARAEDETRERTAATAGLQAEISTLQGSLDAARQVGKALTAAFRLEAAEPPIKSDPVRGWRRAVVRLLGVETRC